jgi:hypothetical protein
VDLNHRPLGYEPQKMISRLYSSLIYLHLVPRCSTLFRGVLFPTCSSICSQNLIAGIHGRITRVGVVCSQVAKSELVDKIWESAQKAA